MPQNLHSAHYAPQSGQQVSGLKCPICQGFIPINIDQLLHEDGIVCPYCDLSMTINKQQSKQALDALAKVATAVRKVHETETFKR